MELQDDILYYVNRRGTTYQLDRIREEKYIDYKLFDGIGAVVFYELEEYTYQICRILQKKYPDMTFVFLDENAALLLKNIKVCRDVSEARQYIQERKPLFITSNGENAVGPGRPADFVSCIYNSINVMKSLGWVQKHSHFGEKNKGKTIFLIDTNIADVGLVDVIKLVCYYKNIAVDHGWIPVVKLDCFPNQYLRKEGENMWEYFFEPISKISVSDAMESDDVISMRENEQAFHQIEVNPFVRKYAQIMADNSFLRKNFALNSKTISYIKKNVPVPCTDNAYRVLGVIMRGTDYRSPSVQMRGESDINALPEDVISRIYELNQIWKYDYIFAATEDMEYLNVFQNEFGEKLLYIEQKRAYYQDDLAEKSVAELLDISKEDVVDFVYKYLAVIYTLAKCDGLLVSRNCGASRLARSWNADQYEIDEVVGKKQRV